MPTKALLESPLAWYLVIIARASSSRSFEISQRGDSTMTKHVTIWMILERAWRSDGIRQAHEFEIRKVPYVVHAATIAPESEQRWS